MKRNLKVKTTICIADIPIEIETYTGSVPKTFRLFATDRAPEFSVAVSAEDIALEQVKARKECELEGLLYPDYSPEELESTAIHRKIAGKMPDYDALVFHGSAVAVGEKAYLFTARSGTGKTTHTNLWLKNILGSYVVNGDKPILRIMDGKVFVCGTPWMGKEAMGCSNNVPLEGLCILHRGAENRIIPVDFPKVMPILYGQTYRPPDRIALVKTMKLIERLAEKVSLYELSCNMEDEAAIVSSRGMIK